MAETVEMVTLTDSEGNTLNTHANTELSIHEAAKYSGYNPLSLRRLDKAGKEGFPLAHCKLGSTSRLWFAHEIAKIIEYKIKANEDNKDRVSKIYKLANAKRRAAKLAKKKAQAVAS